MILEGIEVTLRIFDSYSLKAKRSVVKSIVDRTHRRHNVSVAEVDEMDTLNLAVIGVGIVSNTHRFNEKVLRTILNDIEYQHEVEIIEVEWVNY